MSESHGSSAGPTRGSAARGVNAAVIGVAASLVLAACVARSPSGPAPGVGQQVPPAASRPSVDQVSAQVLVSACDVIVLGSVVATRDASALDGGISYDVAVETTVRGKPPGDVISVQWTWRMPEYRVMYAQDEQVLLFLERHPDSVTGQREFGPASVGGGHLRCRLHDGMVEWPSGERAAQPLDDLLRELRSE